MTPEQVEQRLREIEERANRATPGPWYAKATDDRHAMNARYVSTQPGMFVHDNQRRMDPTAPECDESHVVAITLLQTPPLAAVADGRWDNNTEFIACARTDVPWLVARLRETMAENRRLRERLDRLESGLRALIAELGGGSHA